VSSKNRLPGDGDSFTALLALLIDCAHSVVNVAYLMFSFNDSSDYMENESGTKHHFVPSSCSPLHVFYTRTAFSVDAGMIEVKPTIVWLPRLSPQMVGSAPSDHYIGSRVARPLNGLPHKPLVYRR